jgi:hypothetical protein
VPTIPDDANAGLALDANLSVIWNSSRGSVVLNLWVVDDDHRVKVSDTIFWLVSPSENLVRVEVMSTFTQRRNHEEHNDI